MDNGESNDSETEEMEIDEDSSDDDRKSNERCVCKDCGKVLSQKYQLRKHVANYHKGPYECKQCSTEYNALWKLKAHEKTLHNGPYKCKKCSNEFKNVYLLARHIKSKHPDPNAKKPKRFNCDMCKKDFANNQALARHKKVVHDGPYKCIYCNEEFPTNLGRSKHVGSNHFEERKKQRTIKCKLCGQVFLNTASLKQHKKRMHDGPYQCTFCQEEVANTTDLIRHVAEYHKEEAEMRKKFPCDECNKRFETKYYLDQHKQTHVDKKEFKCADCQKEYRHLRSLNEHRKLHHSYQPETIKCGICPREFFSERGASLHRNDVHGQTEKEYLCDKCGKLFGTPDRLRSHLSIVHSGRVKCEFCLKSFTNNWNLKSHIDTVHNNQRNFLCQKCGYACTSRQGLKNHIKDLHGNQHFPCHFCKRVFRNERQLQVHEKSRHVIKSFKCNFCTLVFDKILKLKNHVEKVHNGSNLEILDSYSCTICKIWLPNNASLHCHRIIHHKDKLNENEPVGITDICTSNRNSIFVPNSSDLDYLFKAIKEDGMRCTSCKMRFFEEDALLAHLIKHHCCDRLRYGSKQEDLNKEFSSLSGPASLETRKSFEKIYSGFSELVDFLDARRKVYVLLFVPSIVDETNVREFVRENKQVYIYVGGASLGPYANFVSHHHTESFGNVSTKLLVKTTGYNCFLVSEQWINTKNSLSGLEELRKTEAFAILLLFANRYNPSLFIQKLELWPLKQYLTSNKSNSVY